MYLAGSSDLFGIQDCTPAGPHSLLLHSVIHFGRATLQSFRYCLEQKPCGRITSTGEGLLCPGHSSSPRAARKASSRATCQSQHRDTRPVATNLLTAPVATAFTATDSAMEAPHLGGVVVGGLKSVPKNFCVDRLQLCREKQVRLHRKRLLGETASVPVGRLQLWASADGCLAPLIRREDSPSQDSYAPIWCSLLTVMLRFGNLLLVLSVVTGSLGSCRKTGQSFDDGQRIDDRPPTKYGLQPEAWCLRTNFSLSRQAPTSGLVQPP